MSKIQNNLNDVARNMMSGVVQIHVEGNIEEDIQSVMNPAIKIPGMWSGSGFFVKYDNKEEFYIRASATSQPLNVREATDYIKMHWKN